MHHLDNLPERKKSTPIFTQLSDKKTARMSDRYITSKLLEVLILRQIVAQNAPAGYPVIINTLNPGFCVSELMRESGFSKTVMRTAFHARTTEEGSRTLVHGVQAGKDSHGQYIHDCKVGQGLAPFVTSGEGEEAGERVWKELSEKLEKIEPGILNNF